MRGWREERDDAADLGLVVIDHALGAEVGWLGFAAFTDSELQQSELVVSGYPSDLGAVPVHGAESGSPWGNGDRHQDRGVI